MRSKGRYMGQAKLRGSREERLAQAKAARQPPKAGLYVSTREVKGMRFTVEDVSVVDDGENNGFFLVSMIDEASTDDMSAGGNELDPDEWFALVDLYGLIHTESD